MGVRRKNGIAKVTERSGEKICVTDPGVKNITKERSDILFRPRSKMYKAEPKTNIASLFF